MSKCWWSLRGRCPAILPNPRRMRGQSQPKAEPDAVSDTASAPVCQNTAPKPIPALCLIQKPALIPLTQGLYQPQGLCQTQPCLTQSLCQTQLCHCVWHTKAVADTPAIRHRRLGTEFLKTKQKPPKNPQINSAHNPRLWRNRGFQPTPWGRYLGYFTKSPAECEVRLSRRLSLGCPRHSSKACARH